MFHVHISDMKSDRPRKYEMTARAKAAEKTAKEILRAVGSLWIEGPVQDITLDKVAEKAGVTVRTILRKYGSREGLFHAAIMEDAAGIKDIKDRAEPGNLQLAVALLMEEYEATGTAIIRTLAIEHELPVASRILRNGRKSHKAWCEWVFTPYLPPRNHRKYSMLVGAFYAATDVGKWKLLRKDLGYSRKETEMIILKTLEGITLIHYTTTHERSASNH